MSGDEGMFNESQMETAGKPADDGQSQGAEGTQASADSTTTGADKNEEGKQENNESGQDGLTEEEKAAKEKEDATAGGEGEDDENLTDEQKAEKEKIKEAAAQEAKDKIVNDERDKIKQEAIAELLKKHNVTSEEELAKKLNPEKELTEEEKTQQQEIYNASLAKYAIENKVFKSEELLQYQNMKAQNPQDLVFSDFDKAYREAHKDRLDAEQKPEPVTDEEVKDAFSELYHLDSDNKTLADLGKRNIEAQAKALISPMENKYTDLKEVYDSDMAQKADIPKFKSFLQTTIAEAIPTQIELGEGDDKVVFKFEKIDKEVIEKLFVNNEEFETFRSGNATEQQKQRIAERVKDHVYAKHIEAISKVVGNVRYDAGLKKGAVGSHARFEKDEAKNDSSISSKTVTKEENQKVADSFNI